MTFTQRTLVMAYCAVVIVVFVMIYLIVTQILTSARKKEQRAAEVRYQDELNDLASKAIRANQVKTEFLRRMSHDIRTPINGICGMIKIADYYADDIRQASAVGMNEHIGKPVDSGRLVEMLLKYKKSK